MTHISALYKLSVAVGVLAWCSNETSAGTVTIHVVTPTVHVVTPTVNIHPVVPPKTQLSVGRGTGSPNGDPTKKAGKQSSGGTGLGASNPERFDEDDNQLVFQGFLQRNLTSKTSTTDNIGGGH
jgi:hypothetical protein